MYYNEKVIKSFQSYRYIQQFLTYVFPLALYYLTSLYVLQEINLYIYHNTAIKASISTEYLVIGIAKGPAL